jgi:hypothetical protein
MNRLKKSDLAFIVKCPTQPLNIGLPVTLVKRSKSMWLCDGPIKPAPGCKPLPEEIPYQRAFIPSAWLKPCNDPGDDAADESKAWLPPVPHKLADTAYRRKEAA